MELTEILQRAADRTRNSNYKVVVDGPYSHVAINCMDKDAEDHESIFLQGDEADDFLTAAKQMWEAAETIDYDTVLLALAEPYIDSI